MLTQIYNQSVLTFRTLSHYRVAIYVALILLSLLLALVVPGMPVFAEDGGGSGVCNGC